jgi:uncharacterized protein (DUF169 family)
MAGSKPMLRAAAEPLVSLLARRIKPMAVTLTDANLKIRRLERKLAKRERRVEKTRIKVERMRLAQTATQSGDGRPGQS